MVNKMNIRFLALDVETPNCLNNRISSIGITTITDRGEVNTQRRIAFPVLFLFQQPNVFIRRRSARIATRA